MMLRSTFGSLQVVLLMLSITSVWGQTKPIVLPSGLPLPVATGTLGKQDPLALTELASHLTAVGTTLWTGLQATGSIFYGSNNTSGFPATLSNLGAHAFRLDVQTTKGLTSTRIQRENGKTQESDGSISAIPPEAALCGLFPFELARYAQSPSPSRALVDGGILTIDGVRLHRITLQLASPGQNPTTKARNSVPIDLYFDPLTHLLTKSVTLSKVSGARPVSFLLVTTYADYRLVGTSLIPFQYTTTMQGELYSTLRLTDVNLQPSLKPTDFTF